MYVDTSRSVRGGKTYQRHLLRESYREGGRVRHRTLANLSRASAAEVAALKLALSHKDNLAALGSIAELSLAAGPRVGAVALLKALAERLGLMRALGSDRQGRLALWQVLARLIDQGSRLSAVRLADSHAVLELLGLETFNEEHLYRNLAWLADRQEAIERRLFRIRYRSGAPRLFLYDCTSTWLEGEPNALAAFGYSRDKKRGKQQIVVGLLTDPEGAPAAVRVFAGNTQDAATVAEQVRTLAESFGVAEVTLVGDRGMLKTPQLDALPEHFHYITAITRPQLRTLLSQGVLQMSLFDQELAEVEAGGLRYILRRNPARAAEVAASRADKLAVLEALAQQQNRYLEEHARAQPETARHKLAARAQQLALTGWLSVRLEGRAVSLEIDEEAKASQAALDGCYALKTDLPRSSASAETIHQRYKDLALVERAFRTFKQGHLEVRPAFVRTEASTRAHVFVVALAYLIERELARLWHDLDTTVPAAIDELGSLRAVALTLDTARCLKVPQATGLAQQLLDAAGVRLPQALPARSTHVATRKPLAAGRK